MSELGEKFAARRGRFLVRLSTITEASDAKEIDRASGVWQRLKEAVFKLNVEVGSPGDADEFVAAVYSTPEWRAFDVIRRRRWRGTERARVKARETSRAWYAQTGKARRASPEMRTKLNEQRRARYAAQKATT
jgi:hypothetical protein